MSETTNHQPPQKATSHIQGITMDPRKMIAPVYGISNKTAVPTVYMNAPAVTCPAKKPSADPFRRYFGNYFPFIAGLSTFAVVLFLLTICMDESRKLEFCHKMSSKK